MNYETFKSSTVASIQKHFGDDATVSLHPIMKKNNIRLDGLTIQDASVNITPTIYLNRYYDDYLAGKALSSICEEIIASYREHLPKQNIDLSFFTDYQKVKYQIIFKLIHFEHNQALLREIPHFRFLDLAVVFCCYLPDMPDGTATILIHNRHLDIWDITADTLYDLAIKNTPILLPYEITSMEDALNALCRDMTTPCDGSGKFSYDEHPGRSSECSRTDSGKFFEMYVLSNTERFYGASAILYPKILLQFARSIGQDFYILPSSVHEVLLLSKESGARRSDLNRMIQDINASQVAEEEILSDHVYILDRDLGFITQ